MNRTILGVMCGASLYGATSLVAPEAHADCDWTVKGKLQVDHDLPGLPGTYDKSALGNVEIKVSAKEKVFGTWGTWNAWPTVRTDSAGAFTVRNTKNCDGRRFKVEVRFKDSELEVRHETSTSSVEKVKWYTIVDETSGEHAAGTTDLGTKTFASTGAHDLDDAEARAHADIWFVYKKAIAKAASYGSDYAFTTQIKVKYPHNSAVANDSAEASYANPTTKVIYIFRSNDGTQDHKDVGTLLHEMGHIWAYNHSSGEICLTESLVMTQNTHDLVDDHCVAFHEGWAEFFSNEMTRALFGGDKLLPHGRPRLNAGLNGVALTSKSLMQRHDGGWWSVFHTLSTPSLHKYDFGTPGGTTPAGSIAVKSVLPFGCTSPDISFKEVMSVFNPGGSYTAKISRGETTIEGFLNRAAARLTDLSEDDAETIETLVDPASSVQPSSELCSVVKAPLPN